MISVLFAALVACSKTEVPAQEAPAAAPTVVVETAPAAPATPETTTEVKPAETTAPVTTPAPATTTGN